jgi:hypothetical protein
VQIDVTMAFSTDTMKPTDEEELLAAPLAKIAKDALQILLGLAGIAALLLLFSGLAYLVGWLVGVVPTTTLLFRTADQGTAAGLVVRYDPSTLRHHAVCC